MPQSKAYCLARVAIAKLQIIVAMRELVAFGPPNADGNLDRVSADPIERGLRAITELRNLLEEAPNEQAERAVERRAVLTANELRRNLRNQDVVLRLYAPDLADILCPNRDKHS